MCEYKRDRSRFWLRIYENDDNMTFVTDRFGMKLINSIEGKLAMCSPRGWTQNCSEYVSLWIPNVCMEWDALEKVKAWAKRANKHLWLETNSYTKSYFNGNELDYCLAADWNIFFETGKRTDLGKAEYKLKYHKDTVSSQEKLQYRDTLLFGLLDCIDCLPFRLDNFIITTIPAIKSKQNKLAWELAQDVAKNLGTTFSGLTLLEDKPDMKNQPVEKKVHLWREILGDEKNLSIPSDIYRHNILIVDDLYQSGASVWCFAEFLKGKCGAGSVVAISSVKSQRDSDNQ